MFIESCSLGCMSGAGGGIVNAQIINTFQNVRLRFTFSEPVDLSSVNGVSFRVVNISDGTMAGGSYSLDPFDARTLFFTPDLTFDASGAPIFGFEPDTAYLLFMPGTAQGDPGPFLQSVGGVPNLSRFESTIFTDQGLAPSVQPLCDPEPNSVGAGAVFGPIGSNSIAADELDFILRDAPPLVPVLLFGGTEPRQAPLGEGVRSVGGAVRRLVVSMTDSTEALAGDLELGPLALTPGATRFFQVWYRDRDPVGVPNTNLSGAASVVFFP